VLTAIAEGCGSPREMAAAALEVKGIEFGRWYA
jgi:3-isopropylmalate dehydratase small subunit